MKPARLLAILAALVAAGWTCAHAFDRKSGANHSACTAEMAKNCTAAQAAACRAKTGTSATTAEYTAKATAAVTAESRSGLCQKDAATHAVTAGASCHKDAATTAAAGHACGTKSGATTASAGGACHGQGIASMADKSMHADCDACLDMAGCDQEVTSLGASAQVVPLKNGIMVVYTADNPGKVRAVQTTLARRNERLIAMTTSGDAKLCSECKAMRGAAASGKLQREVVNIEGGCLTLMTSSDPKIVAKIHAMTGVQTAARAKI